MIKYMKAAFATAAIALLTASPVVADQSADQGAAQKPTLMSDAEMAKVVAGSPTIPIVVPGNNQTPQAHTVFVPEVAALNYPHK